VPPSRTTTAGPGGCWDRYAVREPDASRNGNVPEALASCATWDSAPSVTAPDTRLVGIDHTGESGLDGALSMKASRPADIRSARGWAHAPAIGSYIVAWPAATR
jgi:hypothetical protein